MDFVKIASLNSRIEAETIGHALDQYDIPHQVKTDDAGGMLVPMLPGASIWVPSDKAQLAKKLLSCIEPGADAVDEAAKEPESGEPPVG